MIVLKYSYDTSICASYYPTFNNGYVCTKTEVSGGGNIKVVTYESDTAFTSVSFPRTTSTPRSCITKVDWIDLSNVSGIGQVLADASNMTSITFANASSKLTDVNHTCYSCSSLIEVNFIDCDLSSINSTQNVFNNGCSNVIQKATYRNVKFGDGSRGLINALRNAPTMIIENINTDALTSCHQMFGGCIGLVGTLDLSYCNFTNILNFESMFDGCTNLIEIIMPKGRYEKTTSMSFTFRNCTSLKKVVLDDFIVPNVINFNYIFSGCINLEEVDLSSLGAYKTRWMSYMFTDCLNLKKLNMSGIGTIGDHSMSHFTYNTGVCPVEWLDMSNIKHIPRETQNMWRIGDHIRNIGMLYCPSEVINYHLSQMRIPSTLDGYKINIYYHDANRNELTQDERFNYIYCEEYHGDVVETPNDLELNCLYWYDKDNPQKVNPGANDILDLKTGTITRNIFKFKLNDYYDNFPPRSGAVIKTIGETEFLFFTIAHGSGYFPYQLEDTVGYVSEDGSIASLYSQGFYSGNYFPQEIEQAYGNVNYIAFILYKSRFTDEEVSNMTSSNATIQHNAVKNWFKSKNFTIYHKVQTPYTEQIAKPKALRCYQNGSIITDSQQLIPELVTTLPISNKFETTKLVTGKTYHVYFDGTATELNVGGETVVAYPASPCEFTCGSTKTLTITGTDIANVMVVEKEQKNEQHEINATSVRINRIRTTNDVHNYFDDYVRGINGDWGKPFECNSIRDLNCVKITGLNGLCYDGYVYNNGNLPQGTYRFRCKVKVGAVGDKYKINCSSNPNGNIPGQQFGSGEITSTKLIEEVDVIVYVKWANAMLFYTFYKGQQIEYYDISFVKLSDDDITSSGNIPNINYEETISTPSEPIILRGYGGLQDTYDIATGTVTKRVGQSVDGFDLGGLPSPETHTVTFDNMPVIYENGMVEFYTEHGLYPIARFEVPSPNIYNVSNLQANKQYTVRNANEIYCNGQSVPVRDVMTFTASQLAKGEMVINNDNDKEPMIIEGNFEGREIPSFTGTRSVEALEVSVNGGVNQPIFGKGGRK